MHYFIISFLIVHCCKRRGSQTVTSLIWSPRTIPCVAKLHYIMLCVRCFDADLVQCIYHTPLKVLVFFNGRPFHTSLFETIPPKLKVRPFIKRRRVWSLKWDDVARLCQTDTSVYRYTCIVVWSGFTFSKLSHLYDAHELVRTTRDCFASLLQNEHSRVLGRQNFSRGDVI